MSYDSFLTILKLTELSRFKNFHDVGLIKNDKDRLKFFFEKEIFSQFYLPTLDNKVSY